MWCSTNSGACFYANFVPDFIFETKLFYTKSNLSQVFYMPIPALLV